MKRLLLALSFATVVSTLSAQQKVTALFLGNSYTAVNNLPQLTTTLAFSAGDTLTTQSNTPGGYLLQQHSTDLTSLSLIAQGSFDYVVLQEQSQAPAFPDAQVAMDVYPFARKLDSLIHAANPCAQTVFYRTWGRKNGDAGNCPNFPPICTYAGMDSMLALRYRIMADSNKARLSPVGQVWKRLRQNNPGIELYQTDESHPSLAGSYAAACAFYTVLFRKSPLNITDDQALPAADALAIRQTAKMVVYDSLLFWNVGKYDPKAQFSFTNGAGRQVVFQNNSANVTGYEWDFGNGQGSDTTASPSYTFTANGTYNVRLIASRCGRADTLMQTVTVSATGITTPDAFSGLRLYPNPASTTLRIEGLPEEAQAQVFDLAGKQLSVPAAWQGKTLVLSTAGLAEGLYTLRVLAKGNATTRLFHKE